MISDHVTAPVTLLLWRHRYHEEPLRKLHIFTVLGKDAVVREPHAKLDLALGAGGLVHVPQRAFNTGRRPTKPQLARPLGRAQAQAP